MDEDPVTLEMLAAAAWTRGKALCASLPAENIIGACESLRRRLTEYRLTLTVVNPCGNQKLVTWQAADDLDGAELHGYEGMNLLLYFKPETRVPS